VHALRIVGFILTAADAARLAQFYIAAFDARAVSIDHQTGTIFEGRMGVSGGALRHTLALGRESLELVQFETQGLHYPQGLSAEDTAFQHFAMVVPDMKVALARLRTLPGWTPLSVDGPEHLPHRAGGVTAFKFRDPEGHPLELLEFPPHAIPPHWQTPPGGSIVLGIDHSALSVSDTATSIAFYRRLGFEVSGRSLNHGEAQAKLDAMTDPHVEVTALSLEVAAPHLELLCYRSHRNPTRPITADNDVAATRVALAIHRSPHDTGAAPARLTDPDGHRLLLIDGCC
jgi:catechol 2,3-dioxygenase-like lactoylglutathione lyase family enzyme